MFPTQPQRPGPPAAAGGAAPPPAPGGAGPPGGAPPQPQGGPPGGGLPAGTQAVPIPPQMRGAIDPNNPIQRALLQRVDGLNQADIGALSSIPPQAAQVLKKLLPEVGFLVDMIGQPGGMPGGAPGGGGPVGPMNPPGPPGGPGVPQMANGGGANVPPAAPGPAGDPGLPQPRTRLGGM